MTLLKLLFLQELFLFSTWDKILKFITCAELPIRKEGINLLKKSLLCQVLKNSLK